MTRLRDALRDLPARFIAVGDEWFGFDKSIHAREDIVHVFQSPHPIAGVGNREFVTLKIDLCEPAEALWEKIKKSTRYEIRRAETENVAFHFERRASRSSLARFAHDYEKLAARKKLDALNGTRLERLGRDDVLALSFTNDAHGQTLTWHVYVAHGGRARLLHSVSNMNDEDVARRAFIGRANRFHHWKDILHFREAGMKVYDLGGFYTGTQDPDQVQIARFKSSFGGKLETSYDATIAITAKGRLTVWIQDARRRARSSLRRTQS